MILRLSGADFSANNIGQIQFIRELTSDTLALLDRYTKELTTDQKFAVQDFISGLKTNGVWSSIGNLYLPILAGSLPECLYNIKNGNVDAVPTDEYYELSTLGLASKDKTSTSGIVTVPINGSQQNLHMAIFNSETYGVLSVNELFFGNAAGSKNVQMGLKTNYKLEVKTDTNISVSVPSTKLTMKPKLRGISQTTLGNITFGYEDGGTVLAANPISTDNPYTNYEIGILGYKSVSGRKSTVHYGLMSFGSALSEEQAQVYSSLADNFMSKFIN